MGKKLKIGILGCGMITKVRHAPEYDSDDRCEIVAFYDQNLERAKEFAKQYHAVCCETMDELLTMDLDAVSVCTANSTHADIAVQALNAGKHVLCEKPMALSYEDCVRMVDAANANNKILMIGHNQRYSPTHQKAHELIANGEIGKVLSFETKFGHGGPEIWTGNKNTWFFDKKNAGFGAMADLGIHKIDLAHYILGEQIVSVRSVLKTLDKKHPDGTLVDVDDNAVCIFETENGAIGMLHVSWTFYGDEKNSFVAYGTEGVIRCYDDERSSLIVEKGGDDIFYNLDVIAKNSDQTIGIREDTGVIREFVSSITENREPVSSGKESLKAMQVVFAAAKANELGQEVRVQPL